MRRRLGIQFSSLLLVLGVLSVPLEIAAKTPGSNTVCDSTADYFLGAQDYPEAVRLHLQIVKQNPNDALAHYHLGFAYGMEGQFGKEIREYERAEALGLNTFDLFVNLGVARLENGDLPGATSALLTASRLADQPTVHFDLALVYLQRTMLTQARAEIVRALDEAPNKPEYLNTLAIITAKMGNLAGARDIWLELRSRNPDYAPAAVNLRILNMPGSTVEKAAPPKLQPKKSPSGTLEARAS
jgi:Flp pilus assembly protein TadD